MVSNNSDYASISNASFIEKLQEDYRRDPESVDPSWRRFFEGMEFSEKGLITEVAPVNCVVNQFRKFGHLEAHINNLEAEPPPHPHLSFSDLEQMVPSAGLFKETEVPLNQLIEKLRAIYCATVGFDCTLLEHLDIEKWIYSEIERRFPAILEPEDQIELLKYLNRAEALESFIQIRYQGQKRFSLEGGETLIPVLHHIIQYGARKGLKECCFGMAHRGRLNVLANILGKSYSSIFQEFEPDFAPIDEGVAGDVKYHKGASSDYETPSGIVHLSLCANPSHLESVTPVVMGSVKAKQVLKYPLEEHSAILPIVIHGDAAIAGQGVVYESMHLSQVEGYGTKGTIHIVINNQVGFTATPVETRATRYCTDIARAFSAPVFHVNAEDPESCIRVAELAFDIRQKFGIDVFIDINCYRKYGHNETDEPTFTSPGLYKTIQSKDHIFFQYKRYLIEHSLISQQVITQIEEDFKATLEKALKETKELKAEAEPTIENPKGELFEASSTELDTSDFERYTKAICEIPEGFNAHRKIKRIFENRVATLESGPDELLIDWAHAEQLAYAKLLDSGYPIRISGQDSQRGTFSHRHAVIVDQTSGDRHFPLDQISAERFDVYNSILSEEAVVGFEYGYSLSHPKALVIWEAQFGDFCNGAQVYFDQYLASGEEKWNRISALTLFLPHGYEGMGAEHSSARIERFLQLCAGNNMRIVYPSSPAQFFHILCRIATQNIKIPTVIFTPKEYLRNRVSFSPRSAFTDDGFLHVYKDPNPPVGASRLILCTGHFYYELNKNRDDKTAIVRIEQLYPLNMTMLDEVLELYSDVEGVLWVQEEPENMGAWPYIKESLGERLNLKYVGRPRSAAPAVGSLSLFKKEHEQIMKGAFPNE